MAAPQASLEERVRQVVEAVTAGAPALHNSVPTSAPTGASAATGFWQALEGAADAAEPRSITRLPSLARCKSACVAALALQDALPPAKPSSTPKLDRQPSKSSCSLPALARQTSGVGALHAARGVSPPPRRQFARTQSMFVMPDRAAGGALQRTCSSTLQGMASSPRAQQHPEPSSKLQALSLGADSPAAQQSADQPVDRSDQSGAGLAANPTPGFEEEAAAEPVGAGLTARCSAAARTWSSLSDFSALRVVAQGGRSTVWEAVPKASGQCDLPVALKAYHKATLGHTALRRLEVEQRILETVRHPHIIKGFGAFEEDGHAFLVMEFAGGRSVSQFISYWQRRNQHDFEGGSSTTVVPEAEAARLVLSPLLDALCCLHARGVVHRDIKPANAVFTRDGSIRLIDFGLSLDKTSDAEGPCCQIGTRTFMAPELFDPSKPPSLDLVDRTDCWAIGAMAFQLLIGEPPYSHDVPACLARMVLEDPVPLRMLRLMGASPPAVDFICAALEKHPAQRPSAAALRGHPWLVQHAGAGADA